MVAKAKKKKVHSGGATAFPMLDPKPKYNSTVEVFWNDIVAKVRSSFIGVCLATTLFPMYAAFLKLWSTIPDDTVIPYLNIPLNSERMNFIFCTSITHTVFYFGMNTAFMLFDKYGIFESYKLDRKPYQLPKPELLRKTIIEALIGQFITGPLTLYFIYDVFKYFGSPAMDAAIPKPLELFIYFVGCLYFNDIGFYFSHRLVHQGPLYRYIHKQHHNYIGTIGFAAEYAHPIEQILSNQLPTIGCCMFFGSHFYVWYFWLGWRLQQTYEAHSGYCFYGTFLHKIGLTNSNAAAYHDHHHTNNQGNFGAEWLDHLCGTMDVWIRDGQYEGYINKKKIGQD